MLEPENVSPLVGTVTVNGTAFEVPPPGAGLKTVTEAVVGTATSEAGTFAKSLLEVTKVVASGAPFQFTTEVETNPVPFTVSVRPGEPGAAASGTSGWLIRGTGFDWDNKNVVVKQRSRQAK
jgi:hypothetical protein